jgi:Zn finger protein HypA/HybF involved in hydrogenase expression
MAAPDYSEPPGAEHAGVCLDCDDEWYEPEDEAIVICPSCGSRNVIEVDA